MKRSALLAVLALATIPPVTSCLADYAPPDGGARDSGRDTAGDSGPDAAGRRDANLPPGGDPGWVHLAAIPEECEIDVALRPERLEVPRVGWASCGEGCRVWDGAPTASMALADAWTSGGESHAILRWADGGEVNYALVDLDVGVPTAAFRDYSLRAAGGDPWCVLSASTVGAGDLGLALHFFDYDAAGAHLERTWIRLFRAPVNSVFRGAIVAESDTGLSLPVLAVGETRMAAQLEGRIAWSIQDGSVEVLNGPFGFAYVQNTQLSGDSVVWETWDDRVRLAAWTEGADARVLREVAGGDIRGLAVDGTTLAWIEATDYDATTLRYGHVALWTGTFDGTDLTEVRRVGDLPAHDGGRLGDGLYVTTEPDLATGQTVYGFHRLADGARATFLPAVGAPDHVLLVTATDVLLETWGTYYRVDPRSLGFVP